MEDFARSMSRGKSTMYCRIRLKRIDRLRNLSQALKDDLIQNLAMIPEIRKRHESEQIQIVGEILRFGMKCGEFRKLSPRV